MAEVEKGGDNSDPETAITDSANTMDEEVGFEILDDNLRHEMLRLLGNSEVLWSRRSGKIGTATHEIDQTLGARQI